MLHIMAMYKEIIGFIVAYSSVSTTQGRCEKHMNAWNKDNNSDNRIVDGAA